jgi:hypothetical protein
LGTILVGSWGVALEHIMLTVICIRSTSRTVHASQLLVLSRFVPHSISFESDGNFTIPYIASSALRTPYVVIKIQAKVDLTAVLLALCWYKRPKQIESSGCRASISGMVLIFILPRGWFPDKGAFI